MDAQKAAESELTKLVDRLEAELEAASASLAQESATRDRLEAQLREQRERFRAFAEHSFDLILEADATGRCLAASPSCSAVLGYPPDDLIGVHLFDWIHPDDRTVAETAFQRSLALGQPALAVFRFRQRVGLWRWLESTGSTFRTASGEIHRVLIARDISERKRSEVQRLKLEDQLRQAQKMEAIGQLAGGIAHDFNNLLTAIDGYSELLLAQMPDGTALRGDVAEIQKAGRRAASLTRQLLAFSRRQVLELQVLDPNRVVLELEKMLRRLIGEDVQLRTCLRAERGRVKVDVGQIEQVILNLALNARDAMPHGGCLTIETADVELSADYARHHLGVRPGPYVLLAVTDDGCGMSEDTKARIFEPFFTTKPEGKGTGLGLSTVYGIVKQSRGNIWVYSELGRGTTFKIYLPRIEEPATPPRSAPATLPARGGSETILLVEDEDAVRSLVRRVLKAQGYRVLDASDGERALALCQGFDGTIDLVLSDVVMPGMGGPELIQKLGGSRPDAKVLFVSGYTENAMVHQGVVGPGQAFLQKPFTPEELLQRVREILDPTP